MKLFKTFELNVKTRRSKDEVIKSLREKASFNNDHFKIPPKIFSLRRGSKIEGQVQTEGGVTIVKIKVLPSGDLKAFAFIWFGVLIGFFIFFTISELKRGNFRPESLFTLLGIPFGYGVLKLIYRSSFEMQKSFIENLVLND